MILGSGILIPFSRYNISFTKFRIAAWSISKT
jgi:hypothetical protein